MGTMKRRTFLFGLLGTPLAAKAVEAAPRVSGPPDLITPDMKAAMVDNIMAHNALAERLRERRRPYFDHETGMFVENA